MSLIEVRDLTFAYDGSYDNIFDSVNFQIDTNWKLGLHRGENGWGKPPFSTFCWADIHIPVPLYPPLTLNIFPIPCQMTCSRSWRP